MMFNQRKKYYIWIALILAIVLIGYFMVVPLYQWITFDKFTPITIADLTDARNYYSVVSVFSTIILGIVGLFLGFHYFENRKVHDALMRSSSLRLKRIEFLIEELRRYDASVQRILRRIPDNDTLLKQERLIIECADEHITTMLEAGESLFGLSRDDLDTIVKVHLFVEKCNPLMRDHLEALRQNDHMSDLEKEYLPLIKNAFRVCYFSIASK